MSPKMLLEQPQYVAKLGPELQMWHLHTETHNWRRFRLDYYVVPQMPP